MAVKKILVGKRWVYLDAVHADRIKVMLTKVDTEIKARVEKKLAARERRNRRIAREMKERSTGPRGFGSQLAGWVPSHTNSPSHTINSPTDENPLV